MKCMPVAKRLGHFGIAHTLDPRLHRSSVNAIDNFIVSMGASRDRNSKHHCHLKNFIFI
jgi:hypothetical protein